MLSLAKTDSKSRGYSVWERDWRARGGHAMPCCVSEHTATMYHRSNLARHEAAPGLSSGFPNSAPR
jgi:hypothetical protein